MRLSAYAIHGVEMFLAPSADKETHNYGSKYIYTPNFLIEVTHHLIYLYIKGTPQKHCKTASDVLFLEDNSLLIIYK